MVLVSVLLASCAVAVYRLRVSLPASATVVIKDISSYHLSKFPPSIDDLNELNSRLAGLDVDDLLKWAHSEFHDELVQTTSFGPSGLVIIDKLHKLGLLNRIPIVTVDTLHLFPESYKFLNDIQAHYPDDLDLRVFLPEGFLSGDRDLFDETYGLGLWKSDPDKYAYLSKVEPTLRAMEEIHCSAWITGRRRSQGGERINLAVFELDNIEGKRLKINPLAHWSYEDVWAYIRHHKLIYNPLYDKGYKSIGDVMTTMPVAKDANERSGRFVGLNKTECGMHSHLEKIKRMREEAKQDNRVFEMPTLPCSDCLDVDTSRFDELVVQSNYEMLLEFYSPLCGTCQEFSPQYNLVAKYLKPLHNFKVARFDITESGVPPYVERVFPVQATPELYIVQREPFRVEHFRGGHDVPSILKWLESKTSYVHAAELLAK